jgi:transposase
MKTLLANPALLRLEKIVTRAAAITVVMHTTPLTASCPVCQQPSGRVHSRDQRCLADLPWEGIAVRVELHTRKFFCRNGNCVRQVFCERLPEVAAPYARQTQRLDEAFMLIGLALGGRPGAHATAPLGFSTSARTLLRRVRAAVLPPQAPVRVLGVDDFAFRRGQRYGTILVDLERQRVIELLPDREAQTLAVWLKAHPEVEFLSRDRALAYAEGARTGAPQATQIADRFHLMKNLTEAFERTVQRHSVVLREAAQQVSPRYLSQEILQAEELLPAHFPDTRPARVAGAKVLKEQNRARRVERYEAVKELRGVGWSISAIARKLGMHRETVRLYLRAETFPERAPAYRRSGPIQQYTDYLRRRWAEGCFNAAQLTRELKAQGYGGSQAVVRRLLHGWRQQLPPTLQQVHGLPDFSPPTPRQATWWLLKSQELVPPQQEYVAALLRLSPELKQGQTLVKEVQELLAGRQEKEFDQWRATVEQSGLKELQSFAAGLLKDEAAVRAALTYEWSNGQVEGKVNKLKMLKRTMFGRAGFGLLRARVLHAG